MIYGAYGYTGHLIAKLALENNLRPLLAGRNEAKLKPVADELNLPYRAFDLDKPEKIDKALEGVKVLLHCAGPFVHTYKPMVDACVRNGIHYLDITGEWYVFESVAKLDKEAKEKNIMLMPGTGFDVVPSDCLAAYLSKQLPDATHLELAFRSQGRPSRGTQKTVIEGLDKGGAIRREGKIVEVSNTFSIKTIPFADKDAMAVTIPWGDISTAHHSTGIPNIQVYMALPPKAINSMKWSGLLKPVMGLGFVKSFLKSRIDKMPPGPNEQQRAKGYVQMWGEVSNDQGKKVSTTMKVPDGYTLTSQTALYIAMECMADRFKPGFQTPAKAYGADLIIQFDGVERKEPVQS